jgi:hypothetical protein
MTRWVTTHQGWLQWLEESFPGQIRFAYAGDLRIEGMASYLGSYGYAQDARPLQSCLTRLCKER